MQENMMESNLFKKDPGVENNSSREQENAKELDSLEVEKEFISRIEKMDVAEHEKVDLILSWKGKKPVSDFVIWFKNPPRTDAELEQLCADSEALFKDIGLSYSKKEDYFANEDGCRSYMISKDPVALNKIKNLQFSDTFNSKEPGLLYGFPSTAVEAYVKGEEFLLDFEELPEDIRKSDYMAFSGFRLSKDHWKDELKTIQEWANTVKKTDPVLYAKTVERYKMEEDGLADNKNGEQREKPRDSFWNRLKINFVKYIGKPIFEGYGQLEYAKPLSILQNQKAEIARNIESSKILSPEKGGPTKEQIYSSALALAKKLGWKEQIPAQKHSPETQISDPVIKRLRHDLKSCGVSDEEINKLEPTEAWELLQIKNLRKEIQEPKGEKLYSIEELSEDFSLLQKIWEEAYEKMDAINGDKRTIEILDLTAKTFDDPKPLQEYLDKNASTLKPEEKFFIEMSIEIKKFRTKTKDLIYDGVESKNSTESSVTKEEFANFVDTGKVSESTLRAITQKIMGGGQLSREELSIYAENSQIVEGFLKKT